MRLFLRIIVWLLAPFVIYFGLALLGAFIPHFDRADVEGEPKTHEIILVAGGSVENTRPNPPIPLSAALSFA